MGTHCSTPMHSAMYFRFCLISSKSNPVSPAGPCGRAALERLECVRACGVRACVQRACSVRACSVRACVRACVRAACVCTCACRPDCCALLCPRVSRVRVSASCATMSVCRARVSCPMLRARQSRARALTGGFESGATDGQEQQRQLSPEERTHKEGHQRHADERACDVDEPARAREARCGGVVRRPGEARWRWLPSTEHVRAHYSASCVAARVWRPACGGRVWQHASRTTHLAGRRVRRATRTSLA